MNDKNYFIFKPLDNGKFKLSAPKSRGGRETLIKISNQLYYGLGHKVVPVEDIKGTDYVCIILDDDDLNLVFLYISGRD